jgi:hypothetical protein
MPSFSIRFGQSIALRPRFGGIGEPWGKQRRQRGPAGTLNKLAP